MRKVTLERYFYNLNELSPTAREKARQQILESYHEATFWYENKKEELHELFPNSKLDVQFSLSSCQGDGLNIYGTLYFADIADKALTNALQWINRYIFDSREKYYTSRRMYRLVEWFKTERAEVKLSDNRQYCYSVTRWDDVANYLIDYCFAYWINLDKKTSDCIDILGEGVKQAVQDFEDAWEQEGYEYFYELDDAELEEICEANEIEFAEDGTMC